MPEIAIARTVTVTFAVTVPSGVDDNTVQNIIARLIDSGLSDAAVTAKDPTLESELACLALAMVISPPQVRDAT